MKKIQFIKDTSKAEIPESFKTGNTLVIYRDGYKLPDVPNATFIEFEKYKVGYINFNPDNIIMIGINRIFVPSIRCELVFEYLQTMTSNVNKISLDTLPWVGEPWRLWFHYSVVYGTWLGFNYSYAVETDWQHWFYRDSDNSVISDKEISGNLQDTYTDLSILNTKIEFFQPDLMQQAYYEELKQFAFNKYGTPKQIIQIMLKELNKYLSIKFDFDSYLSNKNIKLPNWGIYRFVAEENIRRMNIYNQIVNEKAGI